MPTNCYGPEDNYNSLTSHFLPALIQKIHNVKIKKNKKKKLKYGGVVSKTRNNFC